MRALPSERKEILKLPRAYIANVIRTIIGQEFEDWVREKVNARNRRVQDEREVSIMMDPEIERIFRASTSTSGKWQYFSCITHYWHSLTYFSHQGQQQQFDESGRQQKALQAANRRGQTARIAAKRADCRKVSSHGANGVRASRGTREIATSWANGTSCQFDVWSWLFETQCRGQHGIGRGTGRKRVPLSPKKRRETVARTKSQSWEKISSDLPVCWGCSGGWHWQSILGCATVRYCSKAWVRGFPQDAYTCTITPILCLETLHSCIRRGNKKTKRLKFEFVYDWINAYP